MGSYKFLMLLFMYTAWTLYSELTAVNLDIDLLTSYCMLHLNLAASMITDLCELYVLGHIFGGSVGSTAVT